jgi:hypothetical protein
VIEFFQLNSPGVQISNHRLRLETYENNLDASFALKDNPKRTPSSIMNLKTKQSSGTVVKTCTIGDDQTDD